MPRSENIPEELNPRIGEFFDMQEDLHKAHPEWGGFKPEQGIKQLLWLVGELGEVIDIVKKAPKEAYMCSGPTRDHLGEEVVDVLMYLIDYCHCVGLTADELAITYRQKHKYNMTRDFDAQNKKKYGGDY